MILMMNDWVHDYGQQFDIWVNRDFMPKKLIFKLFNHVVFKMLTDKIERI